MRNRLDDGSSTKSGFEVAHFASGFDRRVDEMQQLLARMKPASDAVALKTLRDAFPETSLAQRVKALSVRH